MQKIETSKTINSAHNERKKWNQLILGIICVNESSYFISHTQVTKEQV